MIYVVYHKNVIGYTNGRDKEKHVISNPEHYLSVEWQIMFNEIGIQNNTFTIFYAEREKLIKLIYF